MGDQAAALKLFFKKYDAKKRESHENVGFPHFLNQLNLSFETAPCVPFTSQDVHNLSHGRFSRSCATCSSGASSTNSFSPPSASLHWARPAGTARRK
jgi:hypothetical protein